MAVPPLLALKAAQTAQGSLQKALTGDIYTKTWVETVGKGKKAKIVEHTVHVNPVGIGLGALAIGATATAALAALWLAQLKLTPVRYPTYKTIVDSPAVPAVPAIPAVYEDRPAQYRHDVAGKECSFDGLIFTDAQLIANHTQMHLRTGDGAPHWKLVYTDVLIAPASIVIQKAEVPGIPAIPAVTHQELTGKTTLRFAIEQRQPFSIADVLPNPVNAFKEATGLDKPVFGDWSKGQFMARKWW